MSSLLDILPLLEGSLVSPATFAIATVTTMSLYIYFMQPCLILQAYFKVAVRWSGMRTSYITAPEDGFTYFYGEKGQRVKGQNSILLLHGYTADHFMWTPIVQQFPSNVHVIALDLPGHGLTSHLLREEEVTLVGLTERVKEFVDLVGLSSQPLHVVGVSMGATIGALYTVRYPEQVKLITITCPLMKTPKESHVVLANKDKVLKDGDLTLENCPLLPQTPGRLQEMLDICHYSSISYPKQILKGVLNLRKRNNDFYLMLVKNLMEEESLNALENIISKIMCPAQVIWGREDLIVDLSGADVLREKLPNCQRVDVLVECGHAINLDQPKGYSDRVLAFWSSNTTSASTTSH